MKIPRADTEISVSTSVLSKYVVLFRGTYIICLLHFQPESQMPRRVAQVNDASLFKASLDVLRVSELSHLSSTSSRK